MTLRRGHCRSVSFPLRRCGAPRLLSGSTEMNALDGDERTSAHQGNAVIIRPDLGDEVMTAVVPNPVILKDTARRCLRVSCQSAEHTGQHESLGVAGTSGMAGATARMVTSAWLAAGPYLAACPRGVELVAPSAPHAWTAAGVGYRFKPVARFLH